MFNTLLSFKKPNGKFEAELNEHLIGYFSTTEKNVYFPQNKGFCFCDQHWATKQQLFQLGIMCDVAEL